MRLLSDIGLAIVIGNYADIEALAYKSAPPQSSQIFALTKYGRSGPGCSKLTTSLVNVLLKFQTLITQICQKFLLKKFSVFGYEVLKHLTS